jgi:hypothetical protein
MEASLLRGVTSLLGSELFPSFALCSKVGLTTTGGISLNACCFASGGPSGSTRDSLDCLPTETKVQHKMQKAQKPSRTNNTTTPTGIPAETFAGFGNTGVGAGTGAGAGITDA